jgi:hypothetical protein
MTEQMPTEAMIEAGRELLWDRFCPAIRRCPEDDEHYSDLARRTYLAMQSARPIPASEPGEVGQLVEALDWFVRRRKSIENDVLSAHSGRGAGASSFMREDDADFRRDMRAAFDKADTALEAARKQA